MHIHRQLKRFVGAHDSLTARIGERAGFQGIWASGLEITASLGVPDNGLLPHETLLERIRQMCAAIDIPVWVDVDNGAPTAEEVPPRLRSLEAAGAGGWVMEDKRIPKVNSFGKGAHILEPVSLVCEKIRAAIEARDDETFHVIARTETLVADGSVDEALERCHSYLESGATGVVVHTKERHPEKLLSVLAALPAEAHVVAIPTTYFELDADQLSELGVNTILYANQGMRAQVAALKDAYDLILTSGSSVGLEENIATVSDIFALQEELPRNGSGSRENHE